MIKIFLFIGMGSFAGGVARYGITRLFAGSFAQSFWATMAANVIGCFLIGLFYGLFSRMANPPEMHWRLFLTVGFCGGFTTFSTFINENFLSISAGRYIETTLYAAGSFLLGLLFLYAGNLLSAKINIF